jgi:thioredoxin 1
MELTTENFDEFIANKIAIVDFWATWCGPCKMMKPVLEELELDHGITIGKVDADKNEDLVAKFNVSSIPTIIVLENGVPVHTVIGAMPKHKLVKELEGWI